MNVVKLLIEYVGVFAIVFALIFLPMTKIAMGAVITVVGAFFPSSLVTRVTGGNQATFKILGSEVSIGGSLRFAVIAGGIVLLIIAAIETGGVIIKTGSDISSGVVSRESIAIGNVFYRSAINNEALRKVAFKPDAIKANIVHYGIIYALHCGINMSKEFEQEADEAKRLAILEVCASILVQLDKPALTKIVDAVSAFRQAEEASHPSR